ncbi:MAG: ATP-dependent helicase [Deltaproteobacteria bacterium]|nr:ATP-dependent helicase [Deltaproteobacteria bacterium]
MEKQSEQLFQEYKKRGIADQLILQFLAVQVDYCRQTKLALCLAEIKLKGLPRIRITAAKLGQHIQPMVEKGLIIKDTNGLCCQDSLRSHIVLDCLQNKRFSMLARVLQKILPVETRDYGYMEEYQNPVQVLRELQISCYSGQKVSDFYKIITNGGIVFSFSPGEPDPFQRIFPADIAGDLIAFMSVSTSMFMLQNILNWALDDLKPLDTIYYELFLEQHRVRQVKSDDYSLLLLMMLLRGDCHQAAYFIEERNWILEEDRLAHAGWLAFIRGRSEKAVAAFSRALALRKKRMHKRKSYLPGYLGIIHILALIQSKDPELMQQAHDLILFMKRKDQPISELLVAWQVVLEQQLGMVSHENCSGLNISTILRDERPHDALLHILPMIWLHPDKVKTQRKSLERIRDKSRDNNYLWISTLAAEILSFVAVQAKENSNYCKNIYKTTGTVALTGIVRPKPQWEAGLETLINLAGQAGSGNRKTDGEQRLIWLFSYNEKYNSLFLEPRLQKLGKSGKWTKGRSIALKTLAAKAVGMKGLTDQDLRICSTIKQEVERGGWGYSRQTVYHFDENLVLPQLVDHPLLLSPESMLQVELIRAEPEMRIQKIRGKIKIFLEPQPGNDQSFAVVQESSSRYLLYHFNKNHQQLSQTLGTGMDVPAQGEELARRTADALSTMITVQSDIGGGTEAEEVKADATPRIQLLPAGKGLRLEILIRPLSDAGPGFQPGQGARSVLAEIDGKKLRAVRDLKAEQRAVRQLVENSPTMSRFEDGTGQWILTEPADCLEFLYELGLAADVILEWPKGQSYQLRPEAGFDKLSLQIKKDTDWFRATGKLQVEDSLVLDLQQLLAAQQNREGRFVRLSDGSFLALTKAFQKRLQDLSVYSSKSGKGVRFNPLASLALGDLLEQAESCRGDAAWKRHLKSLETVMAAKLPTTLQAELRSYQEKGFYWLSRLAHLKVGACLADDMGLGKTVQALSVLLSLAPKGPILVVAPLSVVANWQEEAHRFAPTLNVLLFGSGNRQEILYNLQPFDLLLCSYGLLQKEAKKLQQITWQAVVLDEAQAIKNRQTKRSRAAMGLKAGFRLITTGTPIENHLGELWTLFNFLNPGLLGGYRQFTERFSNVIEEQTDNGNLDRLRRLIRPFILRRLKSDVLSELPPRTEVTLRVVMSAEEQALYEAQRRRALDLFEHGGDAAGHLQILAQIMRLRRLCCNPALILDGGEKNRSKIVASSKLKVFGDTVTELIRNKHKALVFSQFVGHLALIRDYLDKQNISYQYLDGRTTVKQRQKRIAAFQAGEGDLFLISLKAGGSGLNLTAADYVIHMDPWWNPAVEDQASDRAHRIGQTRPVTVYRLVMEGTIEEQIVELHNKKRDLADSLLEGSDMSGRMSSAELLQLLREHHE